MLVKAMSMQALMMYSLIMAPLQLLSLKIPRIHIIDQQNYYIIIIKKFEYFYFQHM